nr:integrase, catalytic region, zinc finger, CCHC-type, peptidase aspartic, catalytic [Tanacetum cinerariifolium]
MSRKDKNDKPFKENQSKEFRKEREQYFDIQDLKAQLQDKGIAIRMYKLHTEPTQTRTSQLPHDFRKSNKRVSFSTEVIPTTSVSRPQLKSNQLENRVMLNNSQGKKHEVEDHRRNVKFSKNKTSVTACNDSLNATTSNVNFVCAKCGKCVLNVKHDMCVLQNLNGVNSRTKMPIDVPVSTREPKRTVNQSVAKPLKRTVASKSINQKPKHTNKKLYEHIILLILDSGCSKHMTGNLKLLTNFVEKFLGTVKFENDQIAPILSYGDLVQGAVTIKRVYYAEGLNHNLFFVGQFCDADLEVAFRKSTCYIRDLKGTDLLTGSRGTYLYSITLQDTSSPNPICLMAKATSSQARLWHRRLSHLNYDTINLLLKNDIVIGLSKLKFVKDHLCSSCELGKAKRNEDGNPARANIKQALGRYKVGVAASFQLSQIHKPHAHIQAFKVKDNKEKDKIRAKPDKIKSKREAWKSPESSPTKSKSRKHPITMADQNTKDPLLQAPTEGYEDAIVVPAITADNFELKHSLLTLVQNKHLRNEITNFQQRFDESFSEACDRFKDLLQAYPHHGFSELHQLDTFYNALNSKDQDSLNSAAGGNFLDKMPCECLAIIESKSKVRYSRDKLVVAKVSTNAYTSGSSPDVAELKDMVKALLLDKKGQNQSPALVKGVEESYVTCGGAHFYRNCPATDGNNYRDNI